MRLDVALVHSLGVILAFDDHICLPETLLDIPGAELEVIGHVGGTLRVAPRARAKCRAGHGQQALVQNWGVGLHGVEGIHHRRKHLVLHVDEGQRLFGQMRVRGGQRGHRMPFVQGLLPCHDVAAVEAVVGGCALFLVHELRRAVRKVGGSNDSFNAGVGQGAAVVDGLDYSVRMRAPQNPAVKHAGHMHVRPKSRPACHLVQSVVTYWPCADDVKFLIHQNDVWLVINHRVHPLRRDP